MLGALFDDDTWPRYPRSRSLGRVDDEPCTKVTRSDTLPAGFLFFAIACEDTHTAGFLAWVAGKGGVGIVQAREAFPRRVCAALGQTGHVPCGR